LRLSESIFWSISLFCSCFDLTNFTAGFYYLQNFAIFLRKQTNFFVLLTSEIIKQVKIRQSFFIKVNVADFTLLYIKRKIFCFNRQSYVHICKRHKLLCPAFAATPCKREKIA